MGLGGGWVTGSVVGWSGVIGWPDCAGRDGQRRMMAKGNGRNGRSGVAGVVRVAGVVIQGLVPAQPRPDLGIQPPRSLPLTSPDTTIALPAEAPPPLRSNPHTIREPHPHPPPHQCEHPHHRHQQPRRRRQAHCRPPHRHRLAYVTAMTSSRSHQL